jgi:Anion-transporting ATPase
VLLVSTDPAFNLDAVLETPLGVEPTPVRGMRGLFALNIDPEQAARDYRERTVAPPHRGVLPPQEVTLLEERLPGRARWWRSQRSARTSRGDDERGPCRPATRTWAPVRRSAASPVPSTA